MTGDDARTKAVVAAVADGLSVDWKRARGAAQSDDERAVVEQLRILSKVLRVHRAADPLLEATNSAEPGTTTGESTDEVTLDHWGPLVLRECVGIGSFGTVYRAWDPALAREVAVKLLAADGASEQRFGTMAVAEGRLLARVRHPNVISIFGADAFDGRAGFWMEFLEGRTLKQIVDEQGPLGSREATLIGLDLCRALAAVHASGLVHRDVKAQNVMREAGGRIVLMDFGAGVDHRHAAGVAGTPLYMAPEILDGQPATPASDLYSLGVLLFYLVSAEFPVPATRLDELRAAHAAGRRRLRDVRPDLPAAFVRVIDGALAANPAERPPTAGAFEAALSESLGLTAAAEGGARRKAWTPGLKTTLVGGGLVAALLMLIVWAGGLMPAGPAPAGGASLAALHSVAVLPMQNLSTSGDDYFSDGMTELLTTNLSKLKALRVTSRTSVMGYKLTRKSLRQIAKELGVDAIVQGSIQRDGNRLRVTAQLISTADDANLWAETYERDVKDAFALQADLARDIARGINVTLTPQERQRLSMQAPANQAAQEEYLRGWTALERFNADDAARAVEHFEKAITLDPNYAMAHSSAAYAYTVLGAGYGRLSRDDSFIKARDAATRALALDDTLAAAHYALGVTQFTYEWDWSAAAASFQRALELSPSDANAHQQYGWYLAARGELDASLEHMQRARVLDPLLYTRRSALSAVLYYARRYDEAIAELKAAIAVDRSFGTAQFGLARVYAAKGQYREALAMLQAPGTSREFRARAEAARIHAQAGERDVARRMLAELETEAAASSVASVWDALAYVHAALGDKDRAFALLDRAITERSASVVWLKVDPRFDPLRDDRRLAQAMTRVGIPQ